MKFRKKPVVIDATQWFPGIAIDGVQQIDPEIIFSRDGKHFYLTGRINGTAEGPFKVMGADAWLPIVDGDGDILPFAFWEVKSGDRLKAAMSDPLVVKYLAYMKADNLSEPYGIIDTLEGKMTVSPGDWIITGVKGEKYPCKPDVFDATYEPAE